MRAFLKKTLSAITIYSLAFAPVLAKDNMKVYGNINEDFTLQYQNLPEEISFKLTETKKVNKEVSIPDGATVTLEVINARRELRWHVSGLILCKLKNYIPKDTETPVDLTDKEIYLVVKKYEPIDGKETGILTTEIILTQAAGVVGSLFIFFAPVDVVYFFAKGAIKREKHPNWFKAGVMDAYDNSIFWFQLKGKPIELSKNDSVSVKEIKPKKAIKLNKKIDKRLVRENKQHNKKIAKLDEKTEKRRLKYEKKDIPCEVTERAIDAELNDI